MQCPRCKHENRAPAKFCEECATPLTAVSPGGPHVSLKDLTDHCGGWQRGSLARRAFMHAVGRAGISLPTTYSTIGRVLLGIGMTHTAPAQASEFTQVLRYEIAFNRPKTQLYWTDDPDVARRKMGAEVAPSERNRWVWIDRTEVAVNVHSEKNTSALEYLRLWASYEAKIIFNLGYKPKSAAYALQALDLAVLEDVTPDTDCVARLGFGDGLRQVRRVPNTNTLYTGEFLARGPDDRIIITRFPEEIDDFQVAVSGVVLLQHAVQVNRGDAQALRLLTRTARNVARLCASDLDRMSAELAQEIPIRAFQQARQARP